MKKAIEAKLDEIIRIAEEGANYLQPFDKSNVARLQQIKGLAEEIKAKLV
jgi:hypothetical protein